MAIARSGALFYLQNLQEKAKNPLLRAGWTWILNTGHHWYPDIIYKKGLILRLQNCLKKNRKTGFFCLFSGKFQNLDKKALIGELQGTQPAERMIVDQQTAGDIIRQILVKHNECKGDYDRIAKYFEGGDIWDICYRLWSFCKKNFNYVIEDEEAQYTSCPYTMLTGGDVDCKNYALFIGGVLDALRRRGLRCRWQFRFASYYLFDATPGHVFVVVNPATDDIWVDPVLDTFNEHLFYWHGKNRTPKPAKVGAIGRVGCCECRAIGTVQAENQLLSQLLEYQQGLIGAMQQTKGTGTLNSITQAVLQGAALSVIPGGAAALAALKAGALIVDNLFGVGSAAARLATDLSTFNLVGLWNDLWGRTYNTDQYWGAVYYKFYVLGQNVTDQNQVSDADVLPALKWFIDRTGVFISGREHIIALTQSPQAYMNYHNVNSDTTTDSTLVQAAYIVASRYWHNPGNFDPSLLGSWKNTIGVFDQGLVQLAVQAGESPEQYAQQTGQTETAAQQLISQTEAAQQPSIIPGVPDGALWVGAGLLIVLGLTDK